MRMICIVLFSLPLHCVYGWGFFAHKQINRMAVFTLPPEMIGFYKYYILYITENAVNPDQRRYAVEGEAERHFIDLDVYDQAFGGKGQAILKMPRFWKEAVTQFTEDTLKSYGILPWHIEKMKINLMYAFKNRDVKAILRLSADIGHYIGDANVPLHTTENYNGQLSNQVGIHAFWESRIPELFFDEYSFFVGTAEYLKESQLHTWSKIKQSHLALDSVLDFEKELTQRFNESRKYTYEERLGQTVRTYSRPFSAAYQEMLDGQIERQMRSSIKMIGDFWFTAWVEAGQPDLNMLINEQYLKDDQELDKEKEDWKQKRLESRPHNEANNDLNDKNNCHHTICCQENTINRFYQNQIDWKKD